MFMLKAPAMRSTERSVELLTNHKSGAPAILYLIIEICRSEAAHADLSADTDRKEAVMSDKDQKWLGIRGTFNF